MGGEDIHCELRQFRSGGRMIKQYARRHHQSRREAIFISGMAINLTFAAGHGRAKSQPEQRNA